MSATRDRFQELARSIPPLPTESIDRRAGQLVRRRRAWRAAVAAAVVAAIAVPAAVEAGGSGHHGLAVTTQPGSAGMPRTFVIMRQGGTTNQVDLVDSTTGVVVRRLYDASTVDALATNAGAVFISTPHGILRVPRAGGPAVRVSTSDPGMLEMSPDGTRLAWSLTAQNGSVAITTVTVMDVSSGATTTWSLPPESLEPDTPPAYQLDALGWWTNRQLAAVTEPPATASASCAGDPPACRGTTRLLPASTPPHLLLFDIATQGSPATFDIPTQLSFSYSHLSDAGLLAPGPAAGTLVGAVYPATNFAAGQPLEPWAAGQLVELRIDPSRRVVQVQKLATINPGTQAVSLDADGHDVLAIHDDFAAAKNGLSVQRTTDGGPPVQLGPAGDWYNAVW